MREVLEMLGSEWSERQDSNLRPSGPKPDALPGCATLRLRVSTLAVHYTADWK